MKNIIQATKDIREEARGTVMQERVRAVVEDLIKDLKDNIADEVGNLIGELITNFIYEGSEIELELTDYAFNRINDALLSEIKNRSNDHGLKCILQAYGTPWRRHSKSLQSGAPASSTTESRKSDDCLL